LTVCGDGTIAPNEECDVGNTDAGDGWSASCTVETAAHLPPTAVDDTVVTTEDTAVCVAKHHQTKNDTGPGDNLLVISSFSKALHGSIADDGGTLCLRSDADIHGEAGFTDAVYNGISLAEATVRISSPCRRRTTRCKRRRQQPRTEQAPKSGGGAGGRAAPASSSHDVAVVGVSMNVEGSPTLGGVSQPAPSPSSVVSLSTSNEPGRLPSMRAFDAITPARLRRRR
jgi:cysteine-rich repeat protein